jgi:uncharacterized phage protein gp47/JayE
MPWTRPTLSTLVTRVEADITSRLTGSVALLRRSILAILARVFAGAIHILHGYLEYIALQLFIDTAESDYLDRHAVTWGVPRQAADFAEGDIEVTGSDGQTIVEGTVFLRDDGVEFTSTAEVIIAAGVATVPVRCDEAGATGNTETGFILTAQTPQVDVDDESTVLTPGITGGVDQESDEALRKRILARIQNPPAGGSEADYIAWAKSVSGIANAWVYANYYGLGTVAVVITATGGPVPSGPQVTEVQTYIDTVRPVTAAVTVAPIVEVLITFTISIKANTAALRTAVEGALDEMFEDDASPGGTLLISHINEAILTSGVEDFIITDIAVDGTPVSIANIVLTGFQYPTRSTITFNTLA